MRPKSQKQKGFVSVLLTFELNNALRHPQQQPYQQQYSMAPAPYGAPPPVYAPQPYPPPAPDPPPQPYMQQPSYGEGISHHD